MNWNKQTLKRIILTYIIVWVPLLLLSFFQSNVSNQKIAIQARLEMESQLRQTADEFSGLLSAYETNSITLGDAKVLRERVMTANMENVREGLEFLRSAVVYDRYSTDIFLCYSKADIAYSLRGYTTLRVYLNNYLKLNMPEAAAQLLAEPKDRIAPFWSGSDSGYVLVHCYNENQSSVNYVVSFSGIKNILSRLSGASIDSVELEFSNGESLYFYGNQTMKLASRAIGNPASQRDEQMEMKFGSDSVMLRIYYQDAVLYSDVRQFQQRNIILMGAGAVLSLAAAYYLSVRQMKRIMQLEEAIITPMPDLQSKTRNTRKWDEYSGVREAIRQAQEKYSDLSDSQRLYQALLRQQTMKLLLHHLFIDQKELNHILESSNAALNEEYFCLGAVIYPKGADIPKGLWKIFESGLCCEENVENHRAFCFLMELPHMAAVSSMRGEMIEKLQAEELLSPDSEILFSLIFQNLGMTHYAWQDLEKKICKGNAAIQESQEISTIDFPLDDLRRPFLAAFEKRVYQEARSILDQFCQRVDILPGNETEKSALRYDLLNQMMAVTRNHMPEKEEEIQARLEEINYQEGKAFNHQLSLLLKNMSEETGSDAFVKAVEFIHANYQNCNLSADQVAEYGGFNKTYLSRLFKAHTNQSYIEYLTQVRMEKARELLLNTNWGVHEIVLQIGYLDDSSFRKKFKNIFGMSTSEFRQQYRGDSGPEDE